MKGIENTDQVGHHFPALVEFSSALILCSSYCPLFCHRFVYLPFGFLPPKTMNVAAQLHKLSLRCENLQISCFVFLGCNQIPE